jgi:ADP-L-glycero-D-manno-heptose 6-epimerase
MVNTKVLVTGYKGFIGKTIFNQLNNAVGIDEGYNESEIYKFLDTHNPSAVLHVGACSDTLVKDSGYVMEVNYLATKWITDWCFQNNRKIVYSSSAAIYGNEGIYPSNLYAWSKLLGEDYVINKGGIALRYFNVYGPGEEHKGRMASVMYQNWNNDDIKLFPNKPKRDFVYIDDVVSANIYALENYDELKGRWYEVGSGEARTFEDIFDTLEFPYTYHSEDKIPKGYQFYTKSDKEKWMKGWEPKFNLETGITKYKNYLDEKS